MIVSSQEEYEQAIAREAHIDKRWREEFGNEIAIRHPRYDQLELLVRGKWLSPFSISEFADIEAMIAKVKAMELEATQ